MVAAARAGQLEFLFLLGADEFDVGGLGSTFVVYLGTHGDAGAHRADVILPGGTYTEKVGTYLNTEGRAQMISRASFPPGEAREDWAILRALSDVVGHKLPFDSMAELRTRLYAAYPHFARLDDVAQGSLDEVRALADRPANPGKEPFRNPIVDFYLTNPIARASAVMAECSALATSRLAAAAE
jgi:NADH-quinone oxidoreductase subunit G